MWKVLYTLPVTLIHYGLIGMAKKIVGIRVDLDLIRKIVKLEDLPEAIPANFAVDIILRKYLDVLEQKTAGAKQ